MMASGKSVAALYVDRSRQQWVVLDGNGDFWAVCTEDESPWEKRQPFLLTEGTELERVPMHYKQAIGLPI